MSLQKKITEEMAVLAYKIIDRAGKVSDDKLQKYVKAYKDLDRLLMKAKDVEGIEH